MGKDKKSTELLCPGDMEITEKERLGIPTEEAVAHHKSLSEKLKAHYNNKKKERKTSVLRSKLTPENLNWLAVPMYLFTVFSSWKIAFFDVMPQMYEGNDTVIFWQRVFSLVLLVEIMINWFGIRYVDSSYDRTLKIKQKEKEDRERSSPDSAMHSQQANADKTVDSSCAKLLPIDSDQSPPTLTLPADGETQDSKHDSSTGQENGAEHRTTSAQLILEANTANSKMEMKIQQKRSISDLLKSSKQLPAKPSSPQPPKSRSHSRGKKGVDAATRSAGKSPTATESKPANTVTFSYWSWVPCFDCRRIRPPRCHHCPLCKTCMLKRDHHCYFAGNCVGYRNLRYFYVFLLWAWVCSVYSTAHGFPYIYMFLWEDMSYVDVLFPVAVVRCLLGYVSFQAALCVTTLTILLYFDMLTTTFIYTHTQLIAWGLTSFEKVYLKRTLEIRDPRPLGQKLRAVFGRNWFVNILFPAWMYDVEEDPVEWPHIEVIKYKT